jgi:hypothetical protein
MSLNKLLHAKAFYTKYQTCSERESPKRLEKHVDDLNFIVQIFLHQVMRRTGIGEHFSLGEHVTADWLKG